MYLVQDAGSFSTRILISLKSVFYWKLLPSVTKGEHTYALYALCC